MSFVKQRIELPNTSTAPRNAHRFKLCNKCEEKKPPEGGIEMSSTRWLCAACWTHKATRRKT